MTGLLTAAAVLTTLVLLVSASNAGSTATRSDPHKRGPWGIASWTSARNRSLDPHERRWQTALLSGKDNASRWRDLVAEVEELARMSGTSLGDPPPAKYTSGWLDSAITDLETTMNTKEQSQ